MAITCSSWTNLWIDELQLLQRHLQEPTVEGLEVRAGTQRIAQLLRCGAQRYDRPRRPARPDRFLPSASAFSMRRALTPSRSETKLDNLMCASSSRASKRFCSCT